MFLKAELDRLRDPGLALWLRMIGKTTPEHLKTYKRPVLQTYGEGKFFHLLIEDAWELEQDKPLDAMPRTTPLQELERYFEDQIAKAPLERKEELKEAFELARDSLKELGAW